MWTITDRVLLGFIASAFVFYLAYAFYFDYKEFRFDLEIRSTDSLKHLWWLYGGILILFFVMPFHLFETTPGVAIALWIGAAVGIGLAALGIAGMLKDYERAISSERIPLIYIVSFVFIVGLLPTSGVILGSLWRLQDTSVEGNWHEIVKASLIAATIVTGIYISIRAILKHIQFRYYVSLCRIRNTTMRELLTYSKYFELIMGLFPVILLPCLSTESLESRLVIFFSILTGILIAAPGPRWFFWRESRFWIVAIMTVMFLFSIVVVSGAKTFASEIDRLIPDHLLLAVMVSSASIVYGAFILPLKRKFPD